jgi:hypothetical protein
VRLVGAFWIDGIVEDDTQHLFENDGKGSFQDVTVARGMRRVIMTNGLNFGDVDQDGSVDLYLATGSHDLTSLFPNVLLLNGDRFRDATTAAGVGHLQKSNGVALGDLDDDGDLDIVCQIGGVFPDDAFTNAVFENPGTRNHWLTVDLQGVRDNRFGIGSRIRVHVVAGERERDIYRTVGSGASNGDNPLRAHFGLGTAERIAFVEVAWPVAGETQRIEGVPLDCGIRIRQGSPDFEPRTILRPR